MNARRVKQGDALSATDWNRMRDAIARQDLPDLRGASTPLNERALRQAMNGLGWAYMRDDDAAMYRPVRVTNGVGAGAHLACALPDATGHTADVWAIAVEPIPGNSMGLVAFAAGPWKVYYDDTYGTPGVGDTLAVRQTDVRAVQVSPIGGPWTCVRQPTDGETCWVVFSVGSGTAARLAISQSSGTGSSSGNSTMTVVEYNGGTPRTVYIPPSTRVDNGMLGTLVWDASALREYFVPMHGRYMSNRTLLIPLSGSATGPVETGAIWIGDW